MSTLVSINLGNFGSTGRIMKGISRVAEAQGYTAFNAYPKSRSVQPQGDNDLVLCSTLTNRVNQKLAWLTGLNGCLAVFPTLRFLRKLDRIKPDILHFHNLHNSYINLPLLFRYVKKHHIRVVWTLHDCWSFTGHCPYFTLCGCERWKSGCGHCPQLDIYPRLLPDTTAWLWKKKKQWFTGVEDLTLVTPSKWLADLVRASFLKDYPVEVINNGIDLESFQPTPSDFRREHGVAEAGDASVPGRPQYLVLGIAFDWGVRKGLDVFEALAGKLGEKYRIVLVGTDDKLDAKLPKEILSIHRTHDQKELAALYSAADVFVNPTREDNFPTVNIESLACGTPVLTFETGGSVEIPDESCGAVVPVDDVEALAREIVRVCETKPYLPEACTARAACFERDAQFKRYLRLYE